LEHYLPAGPSQAEMDAAVTKAIAETGANSMKQMGAVVKAAKTALEGKTVDGKALSDLVRETACEIGLAKADEVAHCFESLRSQLARWLQRAESAIKMTSSCELRPKQLCFTRQKSEKRTRLTITRSKASPSELLIVLIRSSPPRQLSLAQFRSRSRTRSLNAFRPRLSFERCFRRFTTAPICFIELAPVSAIVFRHGRVHFPPATGRGQIMLQNDQLLLFLVN